MAQFYMYVNSLLTQSFSGPIDHTECILKLNQSNLLTFDLQSFYPIFCRVCTGYEWLVGSAPCCVRQWSGHLLVLCRVHGHGGMWLIILLSGSIQSSLFISPLVPLSPILTILLCSHSSLSATPLWTVTGWHENTTKTATSSTQRHWPRVLPISE